MTSIAKSSRESSAKLLNQIAAILFLSTLPIFYGLYSVKWNWIAPAVSDSLEYARNMAFGTTYGIYPELDRLTLALNLKLFSYLGLPFDIAAPIYSLCVHLTMLLFSMGWLLRQFGYWSALIFAAVFSSSWFFLHFATQVFPEPTLTLFSLLTLFCFINRERKYFLFVAGVFAGITALTKATVVLFLIALFGYLAWNEKSWKKCMQFAAGGLLGVCVVCLGYVLVFDWPSLKYAFTEFFSSLLGHHLVGRPDYNNPVTYLDVMFNKTHLPIFLALLVCTGMYQQEKLRPLLLSAWSFVLSISLIYVFTGRGYVPIHNYIYPGFFFTLLALSAYLGQMLRDSSSLNLRKAGVTFALLLVIFLAHRFGRHFDPKGIFDPGFFMHLPKWAGICLNLSLLASVCALLVSEIRRKKSAVMCFLFMVCFWGAAYGGGLVRSQFDRVLLPETRFFYDNVGLLQKAWNSSEQKLAVLVRSWRANQLPQRLTTLLQVKYPKTLPSIEPYQAQLAWKNFVEAHVKIFSNIPELLAFEPDLILTDSPQELQQVNAAAELESWQWMGRQYWVYSLGKKQQK